MRSSLLFFIYGMNTKKDFTATTLVVHRNKVLLHFHRKLRLMLPLGGHIEPDELPDDAAVREVAEESGLAIELYRPEPDWPLTDARHLARPIAVLLEDIEPGHQHIDLIYLGRIIDSEKMADDYPAGTGSEELIWLSAEDIEVAQMPDNVRRLSRYALSVFTSEGEYNDMRLDPGAAGLA